MTARTAYPLPPARWYHGTISALALFLGGFVIGGTVTAFALKAVQ